MVSERDGMAERGTNEVECKHVDYVNLQRISSQGWIGAEHLRKHGSHDV